MREGRSPVRRLKNWNEVHALGCYGGTVQWSGLMILCVTVMLRALGAARHMKNTPINLIVCVCDTG